MQLCYIGAIGSFQEFRSLFLHQFASNRKLHKTELSLFAVRQKDNEPLKEYLQRFNAAALEVPSATQEVKASAFSQGLLDGDFFKSLAKKPVSKFDDLLARVVKYINMDAQVVKKESRGEKRKETKEEAPSKKPRVDFRDKKPPFQRVNAVYIPLTVPITQALMGVEGKGLLARPRSWKDSPQCPKSDKFCRFHNDYGPYKKQEGDKAKEAKVSSLEHFPKEGAKHASGSRAKVNDPPRKGVIHMIAGGPVGGDSHHARKSQIREAHDISLKEILDGEAMEDAPFIQFGRAKRSGQKTSHNDTLVITALLANYKVGRIFIDSGSSADIFFREAYD
ncbi:UNVERIFIED_CONTAM: hypothetical protein Slati_1504200 [Sesamum latifolium]|uniref:Retrotransposon gag domain-containing protein n=1 Tax=Sesamum latifolium TaxID=2727402 RepID=A0AAW2X6L2_9LAMI